MRAGFPKNDYAPRQGRKGRVIIDDPRKYPAKDNADFGPLGQLIGISGGWAGGEAALVKFKEACKVRRRCSWNSNTETARQGSDGRKPSMGGPGPFLD